MQTVPSHRIWIALLLGAGYTIAARGIEVPTFRAADIDTTIQIGYGLAIADVDGDGKDDILLVDKHQVVWYHNPSWAKHVIAEGLTDRDDVCIAARDLDGDGKAEIAVGAGWNPGDTLHSGSVHYLVAPSDRTQPWKPIPLPHEPTVHRMHWVKNWRQEWELVVVPLHGRGNQRGKGQGVRILAYRMPPDPTGSWTTRLINGDLHMTHNFDPVQWDDDVAQELLIAGREGVFVSNWIDGRLQLLEIGDDQGGGVGEVRLGRLPRRHRFVATIEPMHGNSVVVYTEPKQGKGRWQRHVIDESLVDGHAVACGDLAGLGRDQIVVGWRAMRTPGARVGIKLFTPLDEQGTHWQQNRIDDGTVAVEDLKLADLNGDGRLDIIAAGRRTKNVRIFWNEGTGKE